MSKKNIRAALDVVMTIVAVLLMGYAAFGELFHEIAGVVVVALFVAHHALNVRWFKTLFKGRYTAFRIYRTIIILAMFAAILLQAFTGIVVSKRLFTFLPLEGFSATARELHLCLAYWSLILLGLHAGDQCRGLVKKLPGGRVGKALWTLAGAGVFSYGIYAFAQRKFVDYLLQRTAFAFFDYEESPLCVFLDYVAVFFVFCTIGAVVAVLLQKLTLRRNRS